MKVRKIESLKKNVLLVDGKAFDYEVFKHGVHLSDEECKTDFIDGSWELLGKLKDLTEEQIKEIDIVETKPYGSHPYFCTIYYPWKGKNKDGFNPGLCVDNGNQFKESFLSALEAEGLHLNENPYSNQEPHWTDDYETENGIERFGFEMQEWREKWQEAEQNVFSPETFVFVEQD